VTVARATSPSAPSLVDALRSCLRFLCWRRQQGSGEGRSRKNARQEELHREKMDVMPYELICVVSDFLDHDSFVALRQVYRITWTNVRIREFARSRLLDSSRNAPVRQRRCVACRYDALTYIHWTDGLQRLWIPWCPLHVPAPIMDNVECYCIGAITL
jgi:hypothetical protein